MGTCAPHRVGAHLESVALYDLEPTVPADDAMDHLLEDDEGLVAGELHQQRVELVVELDDVPGLRGASHRGHVLVERQEVPGAARDRR